MKKLLFLLLIPLFVACSSDDDKKIPSPEKQAAIDQAKMYDKVMANIVGHWKPYEKYDKIDGWRSWKKGDWADEYIFSSNDSVLIIIPIVKSEFKCSSSIVKNEGYVKNTSECMLVWIPIDLPDDTKYAIWMEGEYLRISMLRRIPGQSIHDYTQPHETDYSANGETCIRLKKQ